LVLSDAIEQFSSKQILHKQSAQRYVLSRSNPPDAEVPKGQMLAGANVSEKGDHYSSRDRERVSFLKE
jgi:hypothetical protein